MAEMDKSGFPTEQSLDGSQEALQAAHDVGTVESTSPALETPQGASQEAPEQLTQSALSGAAAALGEPTPSSIAPTESTGSAFTGSVRDIQAGPATARASQQGASELDASYYANLRQQQEGTLSTLKTLAEEVMPTGQLVNSLLQEKTAHLEADPNFNAATHYKATLGEYGLEDNQNNSDYLYGATSAQDMQRRAQQLQEDAVRRGTLANNPKTAFALGLVDPANLLIGAATFGTGRALEAGIIGRAVIGGVGGEASTQFENAVRQRQPAASVGQHLGNIAIGAGLNAMFPSSAALNSARERFPSTGEITSTGQTAGVRAKPSPDGAAQSGGLQNRINQFASEMDSVGRTPALFQHVQSLFDDGLRRAGTDGTVPVNAADRQRVFTSLLDRSHIENWDTHVETALKNRGYGGAWQALNGTTDNARIAFEREVADHLAAVDAASNRGSVLPVHPDPDVQRAADGLQQAFYRHLEMGEKAGMVGMSTEIAKPGYFPRRFKTDNYVRMRREIESEGQDGKQGMVRLIAASAKGGIPGLTDAEANSIGLSIANRLESRIDGTGAGFQGELGGADTQYLREALEAQRVDDTTITAIMGKLESNRQERSGPSFTKRRLPLDTTVQHVLPSGRKLSMQDLIDTDLSSLLESNGRQVAGRSALATAGIGDGSDAAINKYLTEYRRLATAEGFSQSEVSNLSGQLSAALDSFRDTVPEANRLGDWPRRWSHFASSTMLGASGMLAAADYANMAAKFGIAATFKEVARSVPGMRQLMKDMRTDKELSQELYDTLHYNLGDDFRLRPWNRQLEAGYGTSSHTFDRVLHYMRQAAPAINLMKYVMGHQSRVTQNLAMQSIYRAAKGDAKAIRSIKSYALGDHFNTIMKATQRDAVGNKRSASSFNLSRWTDAEQHALMTTVLRMVDDSVLKGRTGQLAPWNRTKLGQVLGQFRSFVAIAHNKLLRGTLYNEGIKGLAVLLAYQYPLNYLATYARTAAAGQLGDTDPDDIAAKAFTYMGGLGFFADAWAVVGADGGRGGLSVPLLGLADSVPKIGKGASQIVSGDPSNGLYNLASGASRITPFISIMPATQAAVQALKPD